MRRTMQQRARQLRLFVPRGLQGRLRWKNMPRYENYLLFNRYIFIFSFLRLDNDECLNNPCKGPDEICFNMRGTYRCPSIRCPPGYVKDRDHKSRCTKANQQCDMRDSNCLQQPRFYSFHFVTLVSKYIITKQVDFFHMKGPTNAETQIEYQLVLKSVRCPPQVRPVDDSYFTRTIDRKNILLSIVKSIEGPQDIELQLHATFYVNGAFHAKALSRIFVYVSAFPF